MLNKEVCKRCMNAHPDDGKWDRVNTADWKNGEVYCPFELSEAFMKNNLLGDILIAHVDAKPPPWCVYSLEHVVSEESK
jgi:hypothetical protein